MRWRSKSFPSKRQDPFLPKDFLLLGFLIFLDFNLLLFIFLRLDCHPPGIFKQPNIIPLPRANLSPLGRSAPRSLPWNVLGDHKILKRGFLSPLRDSVSRVTAHAGPDLLFPFFGAQLFFVAKV